MSVDFKCMPHAVFLELLQKHEIQKGELDQSAMFTTRP